MLKFLVSPGPLPIVLASPQPIGIGPSCFICPRQPNTANSSRPGKPWSIASWKFKRLEETRAQRKLSALLRGAKTGPQLQIYLWLWAAATSLPCFYSLSWQIPATRISNCNDHLLILYPYYRFPSSEGISTSH